MPADALDRLKREMGSSAYATKPRLSGLGYRHSKAGGSSHGSVSGDKENTYGKSKKPKTRRSNSKMADYGLRRLPDYTDLAYKEAVSKLKYFLTDNYAPSVRSGGASIKNLDESDDNLDVVSKSRYPISVYPPSAQYRRIRPLAMKYPYYTWDTNSYGSAGNINTTGLTDGIQNPALDKPSTSSPEIMNFMQKQEDYIEQLERESQYCRDELTSLLGKVKEVITENEHLHEVQKNSLISNVFNQFHNGRAAGAGGASETDELDDTNSNACDSDGKFSSYKRGGSYGKPSRLEGPNIVFESRISELEAQLTQSKIDLKKVQDENSENRRRVSEGIVDSSYMDGFKRQVDNLQRDKSALELQVAKLKAALEQHGDCEKDVASRVRRSTEMVEEQLRSERGNLEADIRRLKEELSLLKSRSRDERGLVERRHTGQVEQLQHDLNAQWDTTTKLQLELEKQRREESDLKREISQKNAHIEDLKLELRNKIASLQADLAQSHAEKASQDEELANSRLLIERHQRQAKHDTNRLNSEVQSLRQRLDRADADLVHSRRENLRLTEQLANAEKDVHLRSLRPQSPLVKENSDKDISSKIQDIESKHARTVQELETLVRSQNSLMDKLTGECRLLTRKLEDSGRKHKREKSELAYRNAELMKRLRSVWSSYKRSIPISVYPQVAASSHWSYANSRSTNSNACSDDDACRPLDSSDNRACRLAIDDKLSEEVNDGSANEVSTDPEAPENEHNVSTEKNPIKHDYENAEHSSQQHEMNDTNNYTSKNIYDDRPYNADTTAHVDYQEPMQSDEVNEKSNRDYAENEKLSEKRDYTQDEIYSQNYTENPEYQLEQQYGKLHEEYTTEANQYPTEPNIQYATEPNVQYATEPNVQYAAKPNIQYATEPIDQYINEENQQYASQQNQPYAAEQHQPYNADQALPYATEPNQLYSTEPNTQYGTEQNYAPYQVDPNAHYGENLTGQPYYGSEQIDYETPLPPEQNYDRNAPTQDYQMDTSQHQPYDANVTHQTNTQSQLQTQKQYGDVTQQPTVPKVVQKNGSNSTLRQPSQTARKEAINDPQMRRARNGESVRTNGSKVEKT